ncbi:MAG: hypothetical protein IPG50_34750 [Myxococcales bacterium]|nr:hypothetical protein [Myxococcales bacterium]
MKTTTLRIALSCLALSAVGCSGGDDGGAEAASDEAAFSAGDGYRKTGTFVLQEKETRTVDVAACFEGRGPCSLSPLPKVDAGPGTVELRTLGARNGSDEVTVNLRVRRPDFGGGRITDRALAVRLVSEPIAYASSAWSGRFPTADGSEAVIRVNFENDGYGVDPDTDRLRWVEVTYTSDAKTLKMLAR